MVPDVASVHPHQVDGHHHGRAGHNPQRVGPALDQGQHIQQRNHGKSQRPNDVSPENLQSLARCTLAHLFHRQIGADAAFKVEQGLRHGHEAEQNQSSCRGATHPPFPAFGHVRRRQFPQRHGRPERNDHLKQHQHHLGVAELVEQGNVVQKHVRQPRGVTPRQHHRQGRHRQKRPANPMAARHHPCQAKGKGQCSKVKRATTEALFSPIKGAVASLHVRHQHAPPLPSSHAVFQNVVAVQPIVLVFQIDGP